MKPDSSGRPLAFELDVLRKQRLLLLRWSNAQWDDLCFYAGIVPFDGRKPLTSRSNRADQNADSCCFYAALRN